MASSGDPETADELETLRFEVRRLRRRLEIRTRALRRDRSALRGLGVRDPLTGLPLRGRAETWLRRSGGCLMADLDGFKRINDEFGHLAGDRVLRDVARILSGAIPPGGRIARFGGDEFLIAAPEATLEDAVASAQGLRRALAEAQGVEGLTLTVGAAILGVAEEPVALIARADAALMRGKRLGGNRVEVDPG